MADNKLVPILLLGGAAYLAYELFFNPATSAAQSSPSTPSGTPAPSTPATPPVAFNTLDQVYQRLVQALTQNVAAFASNPSTFTATPWGFGYWLANVTQLPSSLDYAQIFSGSQLQSLTLGQFWSTMAPWLQKNAGLSGYAGRGLAGLITAGGRR